MLKIALCCGIMMGYYPLIHIPYGLILYPSPTKLILFLWLAVRLEAFSCVNILHHFIIYWKRMQFLIFNIMYCFSFCVCVRMRAHICVCIYVCMCACMCVYACSLFHICMVWMFAASIIPANVKTPFWYNTECKIQLTHVSICAHVSV